MRGEHTSLPDRGQGRGPSSQGGRRIEASRPTGPTDLPFTEDLLDDDGAVGDGKVQAAVEDLIQRKPHLAARRPSGEIGQGARPEIPTSASALLRRGA